MLGEVPAPYVNLKRDIHGREGYDSDVLSAKIQKLRNYGMVINANRGVGLLEGFSGQYFNTDLLVMAVFFPIQICTLLVRTYLY